MEISVDHMNLIKSYSRICYKKLRKPTSMEYEDLVSEGVLKYCETIKTVDTSHEKFKAYFAVTLQHAFGRVVHNSYKKDIAYIDIQKCACKNTVKPSAIKYTDILSQIKTLSKADLTFLITNMNPSNDLKELLKNTHNVRKKIRKYMKLSRKEENAAITNIKAALYC